MARINIEKLRMDGLQKLVPGDGIEPPTLSSSGSRSTTELPRHDKENTYILPIRMVFVKVFYLNLIANIQSSC
jgi:hypothetical protein